VHTIRLLGIDGRHGLDGLPIEVELAERLLLHGAEHSKSKARPAVKSRSLLASTPRGYV